MARMLVRLSLPAVFENYWGLGGLGSECLGEMSGWTALFAGN
jgi:hypothetical protein